MKLNILKRAILLYFASALLWSTLLGINLVTLIKAEAPPPLPSTLIFEDDFEKYSVGSFPSVGGWTLRFDGSGNNKIVDIVSVSPSKSFQLQGGPWGGYCTLAYASIDAKCQLLYFQAYLRVEGPITEHSGGWVGFEHWTSHPEMPSGIVYVGFSTDGMIYTGGGGKGYALKPYVTGTWYKAEVLLNKTTDEYWVWLDDQYMGKFRTYYSSSYVNVFALGAGKDNSIAYFDDVKIFGEIPNNPTARFTASTFFPYINETVAFSASGSLPGWNGTHSMPIVSYDWDFGDSTTGSGMNVNHIYTAVGTYTVVLTVTDSQGLWHTTSKIATVSPEPPLPPFLVDMYDDFNDNSINTTFWDKYEVCEGRVYEQNCRLEVSGMGGGDAGLVTKEARDLTTVDIQIDTHNTGRQHQGLLIASEKHTTELAALSNETYWIRKIKRDYKLQIARIINNVLEVIYYAPWTSESGTIRIFISDGTIRFYEDEFLRYREPYQLNTYNCYIYLESYAPSVGQWDYFDNFKLYSVPKTPGGPTAKFGYSPTSPKINDVITFDASDSLPGWNGTHRVPIISYVWNFGDGSTETGVTATHTYMAEGTYTVTLNVTDSQGLWDTTSETVTVSSPIPVLTTVSVFPSHIKGPRVGDTFKIYINIENVNDFRACALGLTWDPIVLQCTNFSFNYSWFGPQISVLTVPGTIDNTNGRIDPPYGAALTTNTGVIGSGTIAQAEFCVLSKANSWIKISNTTLLDSAGNDIPYNVVNGYYEDPPIILGDCNGDDHVDILDLVLFSKSWYKSPPDPHYNPNADFNNNGIVDIRDLLILADNWYRW